MRAHFRALLREPLVHFLAIGSLLFVAYAALNDESEDERGTIVVSRGRIEHLAAGFTRAWQRPPTAQELSGLVDDYVREEVYYREAIAMGLDRDDTVIRRRLRQKLEFLLDDAAAAEPSDAELEAFRQLHASRFRDEPRITFDHVYLDPRTRGEALGVEIDALRTRLARGVTGDALEALGDATLLPRSLASVTRRDVEQQFGPRFAGALDALALSDWHGPIRSAYGVHLVRITQRVEADMPPLATVRDAVHREWMNQQRRLAGEAYFRKLLDRYSVSIEDAGDGKVAGASGAQPQR
jgi:hypothetical protein